MNKQTAGDIMRQMLKDERQGIIAFHQHGETKVKCAAAVSSDTDFVYVLACLIHEVAPTFNLSPVDIVAQIVAAMQLFYKPVELNAEEQNHDRRPMAQTTA